MADTTTTAPTVPGRLQLALVPAVITLAVTLLRLWLELKGAPAWLASREAGGKGALLGIWWLPLVFGPWFALKIAPAIPSTKRRLTRLLSTLVVYGYLARIPVYLLFFLDYAKGWGTHYAAFPPGSENKSFFDKSWMLALSQLGFWPLIWTTVLGGVAGLFAFAIAKPKAATVTP